MGVVPTEEGLRTWLRSPAVTARVGVWLGICFAVAFLTGLVSHFAQDRDLWFTFPTRPVWGYRVTQGLHVAAGTAAVPLLLVKLYSVYPRLFARPPWGRLRDLTLHGLERASIAVLVAAAIFQLVTGSLNVTTWYPWDFSFRATHYAVGWIAIGALTLHVAVKLPVTREWLAADVDTGPGEPPADGLSRRGLLRTTWVASAGAVLATAGGAVPWLRDVSVFAARSGDGPAGIPINKSAYAAGVLASATSASWRLELVHGDRQLRLDRAALLDLPQREAVLPIACVEGWSAIGTWSGVRLRDLLDLVEAPAGSDVEVTSLQRSGPFRVTLLPGHFADDELTLLALGLEGEPLSIDHGFPCRLIAPNRPGVLQTKWVSRLEVLA